MVKLSRAGVSLLFAALAAFAGIFLPFLQFGVRNLPWELIFGSAFSITWYARGILGEQLEAFVSGLLWPAGIFAFVWFAASRVCRAPRAVRLASLSLFAASLLVCVPSDAANSLASRIPLYLNESYVRF